MIPLRFILLSILLSGSTLFVLYNTPHKIQLFYNSSFPSNDVYYRHLRSYNDSFIQTPWSYYIQMNPFFNNDDHDDDYNDHNDDDDPCDFHTNSYVWNSIQPFILNQTTHSTQFIAFLHIFTSNLPLIDFILRCISQNRTHF